MIREVFIDGKQIDIEYDNAAGYIFTSPIFRDITKILSNRTTTYKVPKTSHNISIFGLTDNPDVISNFPYREHNFEEYRDGLLFIKGRCSLLKSSDEDMELRVIWGNTINMLKLKDLKLRDLGSSEYLLWSEETGFLPDNSTDEKGFIKIDFGRGLDNIQYMHPSVTYDYILKLIESDTGVSFLYDADKFGDIFTKRWIPLVEKNANSLTWSDYSAQSTFIGYSTTGIYNFSFFKFSFLSGNPNIIGGDPTTDVNFIRGKKGSNVTISSRTVVNVPTSLVNPESYVLRVVATDTLEVFAEQYFPITINENGDFVSLMYLDMDFELTEDRPVYIGAQYRKNDEIIKLDGTTFGPVSFGPDIYVKYKEVQFGDKFPIVPNLPDLSVVDFLKNIMWQYGLFVFYKPTVNEDSIQFVSISDIYEGKDKPYDWTNMLLKTNKGAKNLTYVYSDYGQKNYLRYKKDDLVKAKADGYFIIDNETILAQKELFELYFSATDNIGDATGNVYARIPLYDADGDMQNVNYRVLIREIYRNELGSERFMSARFTDEMFFNGENGLINKYYYNYQIIIDHPVILECYVYLKGMDLYTYNELTPIYIDGTYYMMQEVTVQVDGLAVCKLIKMPPIL